MGDLIGWVPMSAVAKGRVGLKFMSGYREVKFGKGLADREIRVLAVSK